MYPLGLLTYVCDVCMYQREQWTTRSSLQYPVRRSLRQWLVVPVPKDGKCFIWALAMAVYGTRNVTRGAVAVISARIAWCQTQTGIRHNQQRQLCEEFRCHWGYLTGSTLRIYSECRYETVLPLSLSTPCHVDLVQFRGKRPSLCRISELRSIGISVQYTCSTDVEAFIDLTSES